MTTYPSSVTTSIWVIQVLDVMSQPRIDRPRPPARQSLPKATVGECSQRRIFHICAGTLRDSRAECDDLGIFIVFNLPVAVSHIEKNAIRHKGGTRE